MFLTKKITLKKLSGTLTGIIMIVALLLFVCPMGAMAKIADSESSNISALCANHASANCFGFHLSIIERITGGLLNNSQVFFSAFLALLGISGFFIKTPIPETARSRLLRFRHRFHTYFIIRRQFKKKILQWLFFVNSYSIQNS